jgi:hypothetical protein
MGERRGRRAGAGPGLARGRLRGQLADGRPADHRGPGGPPRPPRPARPRATLRSAEPPGSPAEETRSPAEKTPATRPTRPARRKAPPPRQQPLTQPPPVQGSRRPGRTHWPSPNRSQHLPAQGPSHLTSLTRISWPALWAKTVATTAQIAHFPEGGSSGALPEARPAGAFPGRPGRQALRRRRSTPG